MNEQYVGREFDPTLGTAGDCPPTRAQEWLADWAALGGGVSITMKDEINPWRFADTANEQPSDDFTEAALIFDLENTPGLARAIRIVVGSWAGLQINRALNAMGIER